MSYTVKYRKKGNVFWRRMRGVIEETTVSKSGIPLGYWYFKLDGFKSRVLPYDVELIFPKERNIAIQKATSKDAGQYVPVEEA